MKISHGSVFMRAPTIIMLALWLFLPNNCIALNIEARIDPAGYISRNNTTREEFVYLPEAHDCNRLSRRCWYPDACICRKRLRFGTWIRGMWHFNPIANRCHRGGEAFNCNAFLSRLQCERACR
ncbi:R.appendiculatus Kunitz/BPTI-like protein [Rhipicephalus microplus]|uniref:R.appendiculatus Kunitz/BPTI-like protein n=1 Tax=Rhipicephalus microplus TaxID=6941 RepID=UPI003F6C0508